MVVKTGSPKTLSQIFVFRCWKVAQHWSQINTIVLSASLNSSRQLFKWCIDPVGGDLLSEGAFNLQGINLSLPAARVHNLWAVTQHATKFNWRSEGKKRSRNKRTKCRRRRRRRRRLPFCCRESKLDPNLDRPTIPSYFTCARARSTTSQFEYSTDRKQEPNQRQRPLQ